MTAKRESSNSSGQTLSFFTMRNKLKRNKKCREPASGRSTEVITLALALAVSSCSDEGDSPTPAAAGVSERKVQPRQDQRKTCSVQDVKIAPIFLRTPLHSKRKVSSDACLCQSEEKLQTPVPPPPPPLPLPPHQHRLSPVVHLLEEDEDLQSTRRRHVSPSSLRSRLEEIKTSNPAFPVQTVFSTLQKKTSLQGFGSTVPQIPSTCLNYLDPHTKEHQGYCSPHSDNSLHPSSPQKRRRGGESSERVSKRLRCVGLDALSGQGVPESTVPAVRKQPSNSKLSRSHRLKQRSGSPTVLVNNPELNSEWINHSESDGRSPIIHDVLHREASYEDVLWTDKYSPQHSSEVIGNCGSVNKLQSWLKKWKLRADCDERRKVVERRDEDNSTDSWDCGDFQGEAVAEDHREDPLCNTMLITGPPGVGKTASVYACAQELGFKVFEVNCSSQRSGRHVLSQLKEATQSYLVETSGKDPLKPAYLNNYNTSTPKADTLPAGKPVPPKNVTSTSKKKNVGRSGLKGKSNPAAVTLTNYFKMTAKADHLHFGGPTPLEKQDGKKFSSPGSDQTVTPSKKKATSLILFEEVDVIFDDDVGFLGAIKSFMATTKRPVILTTNDPLFRERFSCSLEEILFRTPSVVSVCSYLQLVCLSQNVPLELDDVRSLLRHTCGDVRRCLLQLQLWALSGGGQAAQSGGCKEPIRVQYSYAAEDGDHLDSSLPPWDTSCTAAMLGLQPVTQKKLLNLLKCRRWSETDMNKLLRLLSESWRGGEPLLYNNLELLLPNRTSGQHLEKMTCSGLQRELAPPHSDPRVLQLKGDVSPKASATDRKPFRNMSRLSRRKYTATVFETTSTLKQKPQRTSLLLQGVHSRIPSSSDKTEQISDACLDALTDFFDLMSYLDISLPAAAPLYSGSCSPEAFVWTGAEIKDGLLDESNEEEEEGGSWSHERLLDIKAAAEGLGCHRCWWRVSQAWTEAQKQRHELGGERWERLVERVAFPAPPKRQSLRFSFQPLCGTSVSHRRYDLSRKVLSSESFSLLGNRRAVCVDYMPVLRSICRSHRAQQQEEEPNSTCVNYLRNIHLDLSKSTIQLLAEDFS
ncbi:ATPase family AAA domain-containing protein 5b isoform X3 [Hippoglossus hippoglossus]|uniref:ATPase family AAA domain-containing protein 5b isoform X3 n=1 Tax=Hippoglossus hippoglossus TaxID=8267 RepID=UPI00148CFF00|nr:ATPase family AAA domain-containing protein 5b isoform X3 [Hippoglossus hippoglossus]